MLRVAALTLLLSALAVAPLVPTPEDAEPAVGLAASGARAAAPGPLSSAPAPCAPVVEARADAARGLVALRWEPCADVVGYRVLRGETPDAMRPLVEVRHAGHVDTGLTAGASYHYAVVPMGRDLPVALQAVAVKLA